VCSVIHTVVISFRFHYAARTWDVVRKSQLLAEYSRLQSWTTVGNHHGYVTRWGLLVKEMGAKPPRWPSGKWDATRSTELNDYEVVVAATATLATVRDYVRSWYSLNYQSTAKDCTANVCVSRLCREALIMILTTDTVLIKAERVAVLCGSSLSRFVRLIDWTGLWVLTSKWQSVLRASLKDAYYCNCVSMVLFTWYNVIN